MAKTTFTRARTNPQTGAWELLGPDGYFPAADLVGQVVNIGSKDGVVFDATTVAGFNERTGMLMLDGGRIGSPYTDTAPRPVMNDLLRLHDLARGYIREGAWKCPLCDGRFGTEMERLGHVAAGECRGDGKSGYAAVLRHV